MAKDSNAGGYNGVPEDEETIGLFLTFQEAAILKIGLSTLLTAQLVPFERIPTMQKIAREAHRIALELQPTQKPKIILPDGSSK